MQNLARAFGDRDFLVSATEINIRTSVRNWNYQSISKKEIFVPFFNSLRPHFENAIQAKCPITTTLKDRATTGLVKGLRGSYPQHTLQQNNISNIAQQCAVINQINVDHLIAGHSLIESVVVV